MPHKITNITLDGSSKTHTLDVEVIEVAIQAVGGAATMALSTDMGAGTWTIASGASIAFNGRALRETKILYFNGAAGTVQIIETVGLNT